MKSAKSFFNPETLFLLALAVTMFLPRTIVPFALILTGGGYLIYLIVHSVKSAVFPKRQFGSASGAILLLMLGICMLVIPQRFVVALAIAIVTMFICQIIWVAWEAKSEQ